MTTTYPVSTFGQIYKNALQTHLQKMGSTLQILRKARQEDIDTVAAFVNIRPEVLEKIEAGQHDPRVITLFALCEHYNVDLEFVVGKSELMHLKWE